MAKLEKNKKVSKAPKKASTEEKSSSKMLAAKNQAPEKNKKAKLNKNSQIIAAKPNSDKKSDKPKKASKSEEKEKTFKKIKATKKEKEKINTKKVTLNEASKAQKNNDKQSLAKNLQTESSISEKRGRKKKTVNDQENNSKKAIALKLKPSKLAAKKPKNKEIQEEEELFGDLEDLSLEDEIDAIVPAKRRPGRPAKPKDQSNNSQLIDFPSSIRLPKRPSLKPKKTLSSTIPGSAIAQLLAGENPDENTKDLLEEGLESKKAALILNPKEEAEIEEIQTLPSWTPRSWVTREGERLIIRGQELVKEEQFNNLETETPSGVISQEEVDEVIRKIRDSYKKKSLSKKSPSI